MPLSSIYNLRIKGTHAKFYGNEVEFMRGSSGKPDILILKGNHYKAVLRSEDSWFVVSKEGACGILIRHKDYHSFAVYKQYQR